MSRESRKKWIEKGYEHFALHGPDMLSINKLSKELNFSRASFYNYFGDMGMFVDELLNMHWKIVYEFNKLGKEKCTSLFPDLYDLLEKSPIPLQFSRQLFVHRNTPVFNYLFLKTYQSSASVFILPLFAKEFNLNYSNENLLSLWITVGESWYSRLDPNDLSSEKMQIIAMDIMQSVLKLASSGLYKTINS